MNTTIPHRPRDFRKALTVKVKSLAAEAKIIRRLESRSRDEQEKLLLRDHRIRPVRVAAREALLALSFLRGRKYRDIEPIYDPTKAVRKEPRPRNPEWPAPKERHNKPKPPRQHKRVPPDWTAVRHLVLKYGAGSVLGKAVQGWDAWKAELETFERWTTEP